MDQAGSRAKTTTNILVDVAIKERAAVIMNLGVKALDALHIACAERAGATVLITTDDAPEKHYEPPQRYNFHTNREPCCMV